MRRPIAALLLALSSLPAVAPAEQPYANELIERAQDLRLHEATEWQRLMHYRSTGNGADSAVISEIDSPAFFLSPDGRSNAAAELAATLRAFARPADRTIGPRQEHPQCRFIGRFTWLDRELDFDRNRLPAQPCEQFREWHDTINPHSLALVFPAAYLNNPSSMFGHTLLRIDPPPSAGRGELTSYAINFSAQTEETNGFLFAIKGLTGLYPGRYSLRKYYELVNDYSEIESRDIWSYPLDFTPAEIDRMLRHLWEMEGISSDYYFLSENCSYQLLRLLETARPGLSLGDGFFHQVEPSATVKRIARATLAGEPSYRPALLTRIRHRLDGLTPRGQQYVEALVRGAGDIGGDHGLGQRERAIALETAFDLLKHRQTEGEIDSQTYGQRALPILRARSQLPRGQSPAPPVPDTAPHRAHDATRISLGAGANEGGSFAELGFRPSFHGLTERASGFTRGAQIEVLDTRIRVPDDGDAVELEELMVADIFSLAPRGPLIRPLSWRFRGGYRQVWLDRTTQEGSLVLEGGAGPAWRIGDAVTAYGFGQLQLLADPSLPTGGSAGLGVRLGTTWSPHGDWSVHAWAEAYEHPARIDATLVEAGLQQTLALSRDWAVDLRLAVHGRTGSTSRAGVIRLHRYY